MVDIAMCRRSDCPRRMTCFRYVADAEDYYQSYIDMRDENVEDKCEMYWQCKNGKELAYMNRVNR